MLFPSVKWRGFAWPGKLHRARTNLITRPCGDYKTESILWHIVACIEGAVQMLLHLGMQLAVLVGHRKY